MKRITIFLAVILLLSGFASDDFKADQRKYARVRQAYTDTDSAVQSTLDKHKLKRDQLEIYIRAFKSEKKVELWGKNRNDTQFKHIKDYRICESSGNLGPKRMQGDYQVPEGYYHIERYNPVSSYYLSLGINYPNPSDRILGNKSKLGGDIFIHGQCVTIGCIPLTDEWIKELYVFCIEAKNNGQTSIPVTIFPMELDEQNFKSLSANFANDSDKIGLWTDLKAGYDIFNKTQQLPNIGFNANGRHTVAASN